MKKLFFFLLLCMLFVLLTPAAFAEEPEIAAVYAAPNAQIITDGAGNKELASTVVYLFDDGSFTQYIVHNDSFELYSQGSCSTNGASGQDGPVILTLDVQKLHQPDHSLGEAELRYDVNLSSKSAYRLYPLEGENAPKLTAAFMQANKQKLLRSDGSEEYLTTMWFYFDNCTFRQYAFTPEGENVLFSTGTYLISGSFSAENSVLLLRRMQKYADGVGLADYDSTHEYRIGQLGFIRIYPEQEDPVEARLRQMTTEEKIAQMLMPSFESFPDETGTQQKLTELRPEIEETLKKHGFAGVIFLGGNLKDTEQSVRLVDAMQTATAASGRPQLLTAVDQEGGPVSLLGHGCQMPGNMALGAIGDPDAAEQAGRLIGEELRAVGLNYDAAPVVDVNSNPSNPVIGLRSFSDDPALAAKLGTAMMRGLRSTGVISTLKHFPGHGDTATDSHTGLPRVEKTLDALRGFELIPFQACIDAGAEAIMTAHIQYPLIEDKTAVSVATGEEINLPATLSKTILTDLLRGEMGFDGVIISDAMNMAAVATHFEPLTAAQMAIEAGVNILLMPVNTTTPEGLAALDTYISELAALVDDGTIPLARVDDSVSRILRLKQAHGLLAPYKSGDLEARVEKALETVGSQEHHEFEHELASRALTLVKNENGLLPLHLSDEKTLILVPYASEVQSAVYAAEKLKSEGKLPDTADVRAVSYDDFSKADLADVKHLIAVSAIYSASEMDPWTKDGAYSLLIDRIIEAVHEQGGDVVIVSAQLPYDADRYLDADAVVVAWYAKGMSEDPGAAEGAPLSYGANLPAALMQILSADGVFPGRLPIKLPALDEDGQFAQPAEEAPAEEPAIEEAPEEEPAAEEEPVAEEAPAEEPAEEPSPQPAPEPEPIGVEIEARKLTRSGDGSLSVTGEKLPPADAEEDAPASPEDETRNLKTNQSADTLSPASPME